MDIELERNKLEIILYAIYWRSSKITHWIAGFTSKPLAPVPDVHVLLLSNVNTSTGHAEAVWFGLLYALDWFLSSPWFVCPGRVLHSNITMRTGTAQLVDQLVVGWRANIEFLVGAGIFISAIMSWLPWGSPNFPYNSTRALSLN
jgi:hypothetical protein